MRYPDLTKAQRDLYLETITRSHQVRILVDVYDENEDLIGPLDVDVTGGQVDCDDEQDITRTLSLTLVDPNRKLTFDSNGQVFANHFLAVSRGVYVPELATYTTEEGEQVFEEDAFQGSGFLDNAIIDISTGWVDVPIFYGPVSRFARDASEVTVEAVGKEALLLPPRQYHFPDDPENIQGRELASYIRNHARSMGESRFSLGSIGNAKISRDESADAAKSRDDGLWPYLKELAELNDFQLYYDAEGYLTARRERPNSPAYSFRDGDDGVLLDEPVVSYDLSELRNVVRVVGKDGDGKNVTLATARLRADHPLSPESLAWNGEPRIFLETVKFDHEIRVAHAVRVAKTKLKRLSQTPVEVGFTCLVVPHLELRDTAELVFSANPQATQFSLTNFSIPLTASDSMSVGSNISSGNRFGAKVNKSNLSWKRIKNPPKNKHKGKGRHKGGHKGKGGKNHKGGGHHRRNR